MLQLATQVAHERGMKLLLLAVLEALLDASSQDVMNAGAETITLIRCIIRLVLSIMSAPATDL